MTEMAPVGYVGVSPKCILGFNKVNISYFHKYIHAAIFLRIYLVDCYSYRIWERRYPFDYELTT